MEQFGLQGEATSAARNSHETANAEIRSGADNMYMHIIYICHQWDAVEKVQKVLNCDTDNPDLVFLPETYLHCNRCR